MAAYANPLMNVPGLGGYLAAEQGNQARTSGQLQQAQAVIGLRQALQQQDDKAQLQQLLQASGGDIEKAGQPAVKSGNVAAAHQLAPLAKLAQERREQEETRRGLTDLYGGGAGAGPTAAPQNPMVPGPGASVMAGSGAVIPQPAPQPNPAAANAQRREHLQKMSLVYANNPTMQSRILAEIGKLDEQAKAPPMSPLGKYIAERDKLPPGHPDRKIYEQAITKYQPGGVQVNINPNDPLIPGKTAQNKVDEGLLDTGMRLQSLGAIERQFRPEFQELGTRFNALRLAAKDQYGGLIGMKLDPGQEKFLTEFSQYKRNSIDALNQYIKSVTGAAMTNAEAERILRGLPNPGTGLFDGDSPVEFKAKMDDAIKQSRLAEARLVYVKRNGMNVADISLDRMPRLMNERGGVIEAAIKKQQPSIKEADLRKLVKRNLAQEFGLVE